jgi:type VI secretion system protein ImpG
MADEMLAYYEQELVEIRRRAAAFAEAYPRIAARLKLSGPREEDPHIGRLIEGFAFLTARLRKRLDDDFPELPRALLQVLYPHYVAPIPSMAIVQFECQGDLVGSHIIPRLFPLETDPVNGEPCRFRTGYATELWPLRVEEARLVRRPFIAPEVPSASSAPALLRLVLAATDDATAIDKLAPDRLRFYLTGGSGEAYDLYELLMSSLQTVAVAGSARDTAALWLGADAIRPVGFEPEEALLDSGPRSFAGYRLLTEYFAFPQKFLFVDIAGLRPKTRLLTGNRLELYFYLSRTAPDLEPRVSASSFALGCAPVVNLFQHVAEPIRLNHRTPEYRIVPDARRPRFAEINACERVTEIDASGHQKEYAPFFSIDHGEAHQRYWHATRRPSAFGEAATEMFIAVADLTFSADAPDNATLVVETVCCNRDLPAELPFGGGQPRLRPGTEAGAVTAIRCLTKPTPTLRKHLGDEALWRLVSHLSLNQLLISGNEAGAQALREILMLYDFSGSAEARATIAGLVSVSSRRVVRRMPAPGAAAVGQGVEITLELDPARLIGSGAFLFAALLDRFLGQCCTINGFTQCVLRLTGHDGIIHRWQPRAGDKPLL